MSRFGAFLLVTMVVLAGAGGCAGSSGAPAPPSGELKIQPVWTSCADEVPTPSGLGQGGADVAGLPRLDDSFRPVAAVVCSSAPVRRPGGGEDPTATESRADDVAALVTALKLPDEKLSGGACTAEFYVAPFFALLDAEGRWVHPGLPGDACGKVRIEVREALQGLRLTPVSSRPIRELESDEAAAAGCTQQWADMVWATAQMGASGEPVVVPPGFDGPVPARVCVYRVPADQQRTGKPAGDFLSGRTLTGEQWTAARQAFESAGPAEACTTPATRFAVLHFGAGELYAELDGCRRVLAPAADGSQTIRQAAPALSTLLAGR
jgi:hypothetical protein